MTQSFKVVEDRLSDKEVASLLKIITNYSGYDPKPLFEGTGLFDKDMLEVQKYYPDFDPDGVILKVVNMVEDYYRSTHEFLGELVFSRTFGVTMLEGAMLHSHRDEDPNSDGEFDGKKRSHVCSIILNDDYEGGYLLFPDQNESVRPKAGSMVFFPGYYVSHGVSEILKGTRRVLLVFFYDVLP